MRLSLEEMNVLSEQLEKREARLHLLYDQNPAQQEETLQSLHILSSLQRKLRDLEADLSNEEKQALAAILKDEMNHIHGHGTGIYESILAKVTE
ncbi:hypothetical protein ACFO25_02260 [Paenactinomyces guangxiensis]|uniref:Uncharacterized protein n=1 Tax=Paenactinomyces guangxiensis TaxID=1490290 RepID=A0A7W1WUN9_9BACL|nr:hypothetical protein [Paenactinomyces guangxiensis]MBA4496390.1 hypothetical protein [Paenactinomyces guangxiensis]MBH8593497.1 hypothetical protein [Paenactinomyces guangxiensis]